MFDSMMFNPGNAFPAELTLYEGGDTPGGDLTSGGGNAAAFDGDTEQTSGNSATKGSGSSGYLQHENYDSVPLTLCRVWRPTDSGYDGTGGGGTITFTVETSTTGSWSGEESELGENTATDYDGARSGYDYTEIELSGDVEEFVRVVVSTAGNGARVCEVQFFTGSDA